MARDNRRLYVRVQDKWVVSCPTEDDPVFTAWGPNGNDKIVEFKRWPEAFAYALEQASK